VKFHQAVCIIKYAQTFSLRRHTDTDADDTSTASKENVFGSWSLAQAQNRK